VTLPDDLRILFQTGAISHDELMRRYHLASQRECEWGTCGHAGAPGVVWSQVMAAPRPRRGVGRLTQVIAGPPIDVW
jgi:hypothetical protein